MMKTHNRIRSVALFCIPALAVVAFVVQGQKAKAEKFTPYTITWQMTEYHADGRVVQTYRETRFYYSSGNWRSRILFPDGKTVERVAEGGSGSFTVDQKTGRRSFFSPFPERLKDDPKRHKKWARTELMLGYVAEVLRLEVSGESHELYHAPRLNNDIIKFVRRGRDVTRVLEPVSIVLGEPAS